MYRAIGQVFEFGVQRPATNRRGEAITQSDFNLKFIWADWRIVHEGTIILGSSDYSSDERFYDSNDPPHAPYDAESRLRANRFFDAVREGKFTVESVELTDLAEVNVQLSHGVLLESFASSGENLDLWWFHNRRTDVSCLVGPSGANWGKSS